MKTLKALTLGLAVVAAFAGTASAQTIIKITGSTAFRSGASASIVNYLATAGGAHSVYCGYGNGTDPLGANSQIFANGTIGGTATTIVETFWSGSLAGVVDVVATNSALNSKYIDPATMGSTSITAVNAAGPMTISATPSGGVAITPTFANGSPDAAFSDSVNTTIQSELLGGAAFVNPSTPVGTFTTIKALANGCAASNVVDAGGTAAATAKTVGIVPFEWVVGNITTASDIPANIDQQTARSLISIGSVAQSQLTGGITAADSANYFYFMGRNEDSGTRIEYLMESQTGVQAPLIQFVMNGINSDGSAPGGTVTNAFECPVTPIVTEPNIVWNAVGHSGYASGSSSTGVGFALEGAENNTPFTFSDGNQAFENSGASYFISSLGVPDAVKASTGSNHAHVLTYNGVAYTPQAVENGQYTAWCYEHVYRLTSLASAKATIVNGIADQVFTTGATAGGAGILYGSMNVGRSTTEGGIIVHN